MKMIPAILVFFIAVIFIACGKDKFETKPLLQIKSYSTKDLLAGQQLVIKLDYFDKEGDLSKALFYTRLKRLNVVPLGPGQDKADSLDTNLPEFPDKDKGEITFRQDYGFLKESLIENDTIVFRFAVRDKAGHASDTVTTSPIVIHL